VLPRRRLVLPRRRLVLRRRAPLLRRVLLLIRMRLQWTYDDARNKRLLFPSLGCFLACVF
jgi:hypothetical protein